MNCCQLNIFKLFSLKGKSKVCFRFPLMYFRTVVGIHHIAYRICIVCPDIVKSSRCSIISFLQFTLKEL